MVTRSRKKNKREKESGALNEKKRKLCVKSGRRPIWRMRERSCKCSWGRSKKVKQESDYKGEFDKYTQLWKEERVNTEEEGK